MVMWYGQNDRIFPREIFCELEKIRVGSLFELPVPSPGVLRLIVGRISGQGWSMLHKPCQLLARESNESHICYIFAKAQHSNLSTFPFQNVRRRVKREAASAL